MAKCNKCNKETKTYEANEALEECEDGHLQMKEGVTNIVDADDLPSGEDAEKEDGGGAR